LKKHLTTLLTIALALMVTTAWADIDPRVNFGTCGFTSTEETWEPDTSGTLVKRVTYVSECDTPGAGDETLTITTEEWNGVSLVTTEVREAVRIDVGGVFYTTTEIFDGSMTLTSKVDHTYDEYVTDGTIWFQDWTYSTWNGVSFDMTGYTTRTTELLGGDEHDVTYIYYDTTPRAFPVIPDDVPVLGSSSSSSSILPPLNKHIDLGHYANLGRMFQRVRNTLRVNPNTQFEGNAILIDAGLPVSHTITPPSMYVSRVLKGDRYDDPDITFTGYWHRWVSFDNDVSGNLTATFGWTSDRDLNALTSDWWQARVKQDAAGAIQYIENAHRSGLTEEDHYDTYTLLNSMFMIDSQTVKIFDWDDVNIGDFSQDTTVTNSMAAPVSYSEWTVVFD
jgi:hypothetical protein